MSGSDLMAKLPLVISATSKLVPPMSEQAMFSSPRYSPSSLEPITPPIGPETMVRASSLAFQLIVPPCVAITRRSNFAPCFLKRSLTFFSVWREGSAP